ncbi:hypothetical protein AVEN_248760-1 [Araneus ventricosus]|uniref:Uncharacterized protein n=1 Tax=Araneus ventricosus TaxID=182803 RepID=A0A4Y2LRD2_ARAVE|nr:hypothetical protein AVEN_248760-1 [Araneus ventricosus]
MGVIVSCRGKNPEEATADEERQSNNASPDPENAISPIQTTTEFIRPLENPYPPLPPVDEVEYGPGAAAAAANIPRPKTYAVVVSRLAGHRWLKLKLEPREKADENPVEETGAED